MTPRNESALSNLMVTEHFVALGQATHFSVELCTETIYGENLARLFSHILSPLSVVRWQSLTAALVIKTSVENGITGVV